MAKKTSAGDPVVDRLDLLLRATQDLFILNALNAGVKVDDVRKILKIDKLRVSNISKYLKDAK